MFIFTPYTIYMLMYAYVASMSMGPFLDYIYNENTSAEIYPGDSF